MKNQLKKIFFRIRKIKSRFVIFSAKLLDRLSILGFYQSVPDLGINKKDELTFSRWAAIEENLPDRGVPLSALDLGSNSGFYSISLAKKGHCVTALDYSIVHYSFLYNAINILGLNNVFVGKMCVKPGNIDGLPSYDCVLLLNVFHHWCRAYGKDEGLAMLDKIYRKTNDVMFFETGQPDTDPWVKDALPEMGDNPSEWIIEHFKSKGATDVREIYRRKTNVERSFILVKK